MDQKELPQIFHLMPLLSLKWSVRESTKKFLNNLIHPNRTSCKCQLSILFLYVSNYFYLYIPPSLKNAILFRNIYLLIFLDFIILINRAVTCEIIEFYSEVKFFFLTMPKQVITMRFVNVKKSLYVSVNNKAATAGILKNLYM